MKVRGFELKFIDHDKKQILIICAKVHSTKVMEWVHNEDDVEKDIEWMIQHHRWEHMLKKKIHQLVKEKYFQNVAGKFGDYKLIKMKKKKEEELVNMDAAGEMDPSGGIRFRKIKLCEKLMTKFVRGQKPDNWTDMFDYKKIFRDHEFLLTGDVNDANIELKPIASFDITEQGGNISNASLKTGQGNYVQPTKSNAYGLYSNASQTQNQLATNQLASQFTTNQQANQFATNQFAANQTGGNDDYQDKYMKYKKKYMDLKNTKTQY